MSLSSKPNRGTALLAMVGFSLASLVPDRARGSSTSTGSTGSTTSGTTSGTSTDSSVTVATLIITGTTLVIAVAAIVVTYSIVAAKNRQRLEEARLRYMNPPESPPEPEPAPEPVPGPGAVPDVQKEEAPAPGADESTTPMAPEEWAGLLIDTGILAMRTDLAMDLSTMIQSPTAFDQLSDELHRGEGPGLDALRQSSGVSLEALRSAWESAATSTGEIQSTEAAVRFTMHLLAELAPLMEPSRVSKSELVWELVLERERASFPEDAPTHRWMATWMGMTQAQVEAATAAAFGTAAPTRKEVFERPEHYLEAVIAHATDAHPAGPMDRMQGMLKRVEAYLPDTLVFPEFTELGPIPG